MDWGMKSEKKKGLGSSTSSSLEAWKEYQTFTPFSSTNYSSSYIDLATSSSSPSSSPSTYNPLSSSALYTSPIPPSRHAAPTVVESSQFDLPPPRSFMQTSPISRPSNPSSLSPGSSPVPINSLAMSMSTLTSNPQRSYPSDPPAVSLSSLQQDLPLPFASGEAKSSRMDFSSSISAASRYVPRKII